MTEVQFAKQFLTTLDSKNTKYQPDHVFDPATFQTRTPYTLPKLSNPPHPLPPKTSFSSEAAPGSLPTSSETESNSINLTLKSSRNPTFTLNLLSIPLSTQIASLKTHIQTILTETPPEKIKILYNKKPISPTKPTINDVLDSPELSQSEVEFTVMIMGGASDPTPSNQTIDLKEATTTSTDSAPKSESKEVPTEPSTQPTQTLTDPVQPGDISGKTVLSTTEFWDDLQGFLEQRLKDTDEAQRVRGIFEAALKK